MCTLNKMTLFLRIKNFNSCCPPISLLNICLLSFTTKTIREAYASQSYYKLNLELINIRRKISAIQGAKFISFKILFHILD